MKILLAAINAKYIHTNPAIRSLQAVAADVGADIELGEYTINHSTEVVRRDIYLRRPDVLCFSCYIWNIRYVEELVRDLAKIRPGIPIWLGGPEVSYDAPQVLERLPQAAGVMTGPGEKTFRRLVEWYEKGTPEPLASIPGLYFREESGEIRATGPAEVMPLSEIPFWYENLSEFANRIVYYESSRGCPFSCSYCLSSIDRTLQFRDLSLVERELAFFLERKVPQVKFIDRTFNCREEHALAIWRYLAEHDNGVTNFHFEIAADLLSETQMEVLSAMRPGQVQLEIGVQSTNPATVRGIRRVMDFAKLSERVRRIGEWHNIHQHLDLIAGLPFEDYDSFARSFDDVYALRPQQLQLGFLKVLKGSHMEKMAEEYGLLYSEAAPYEVLATRWLPHEKVLRLKGVEAVLEMYYNSGQFAGTLHALHEFFGSAFLLYEKLAKFMEEQGFDVIQPSRVRKYENLLAFAISQDAGREGLYRELLTEDCYLRENMRNRPEFALPVSGRQQQAWKDFLWEEAENHRYFPAYADCSYRELMRALHAEWFRERGRKELVIFDYRERDPLTGNARAVRLSGMW